MQPYSVIDKIIVRFDKIFRAYPKKSLYKKTSISPNNNDQADQTDFLSKNERKHSAALMRINHSGEVCAQALYIGQALVARNRNLANHLYEAAEEEQAHLQWCANRISELNGHRSLLNPLWAIGSFGIGVTAGLLGDKISLSFLAETEEQVTRHLDRHLQEISILDKKSQALLTKMREDEMKHATHALDLGGVSLPKPICGLMSLCSKIMTTTARYI